MANNQEVSRLFNAKAQSWNDKYRPNGPLAARLNVFSEHLTRLVGTSGTILDFGCGTGVISAMLAQRGYAVTACDVADQMIEVGKKTYPELHINWVQLPSDWNRLPLESNTFDAIVASSVFEYLSDVKNALKECGRVLKPGGKLIFSAPNPSHRVRKVERRLRPLAMLTEGNRFIQSLPKVGNYLAYLRVSHVRYSVEEWCQCANAVGLRPVALPGPAPTAAPHGTLMHLVFERMA